MKICPLFGSILPNKGQIFMKFGIVWKYTSKQWADFQEPSKDHTLGVIFTWLVNGGDQIPLIDTGL